MKQFTLIFLICSLVANVFAIDPPMGNSLYFDGDDDRVYISAHDSLNFDQGTIEFFFKPYPVSGYSPTIIASRDLSDTRFSLHVSSNLSMFRFWNGSDVSDYNFSFSAGTWYHGALVTNDTISIFYVDGDSVGAVKNVYGTSKDFPLHIGSSDGFAEYFKGQIDQVRIWNYARPADSVKTNISTVYSGTEPGLVALFDFNDGSTSTTITDKANGFVGVLVNDPTWVQNETGLSGPYNVKAVTLTESSILASWDKPLVGLADSYTIQVDDNADFSSPLIDSSNVTTTNLEVGGLSPLTTYYCRVKAVNANGEGFYSETSELEIQLPAPKAISPESLNSFGYIARWDKEDIADSYLVDVATDIAFTNFIMEALNVGDTNAYMVEGLSPGFTTFYRVRAENPNLGTSANSNTIQVITPREPAGSSLYFDGTDDFVDCGHDIDLANKSFSVSFWAARSSQNRYDYVIAQGVGQENQGLHIGFRNNNRFTIAFFADDLTTTSSYTDKNWHHWVCTYNNENHEKKIYRDGQLVASGIGNGDFKYTGQLPLSIANTYYWDNNYFRGLVDEVGIWDIVLTESDAVKIYQATPNGTETGLLAFYDFDLDVCSKTLPDLAGNNTGNIIGNPVWTSNQMDLTLARNVETTFVADTAVHVDWLDPALGIPSSYQVQLDDQIDFSSPVFDSSGIKSTEVTIYGLSAGTTYYTRVKALDAFGRGDFTCPDSIETKVEAPIALYPSNVTSTSFRANWSNIPGADKYYLDVSLLPDFSSFIIENESVTVDFREVTGLTAGDTWYYRVRSERNGMISKNSNVMSTGVPGGYSMYFDGSDNYVQLSSSPLEGLDDMTIEFWYNGKTNAQWARVFDFGNGPGSFVMFTPLCNTNKPVFEMGVNGTYRRLYSSQLTTLNKWVHVAIVLDGDHGKIYMDGKLTGENTGFTWDPSMLGKMSNSFFGKSQYPGDVMLNAMLDDFVVWDHARSLEQIHSDMIADFIGNETGLVAYYNFDGEDACSDSIIDLSGKINGTSFGDPQYVLNSASLSSPVPITYDSKTDTSFRAMWTAPQVGTAASYTLQVDDADDFASPVLDSTGIIATQCVVSNLVSGGTYYFRVIAIDADGNQVASCTESLLVGFTPTIALPATDVNDTVFTANWLAAYGAGTYYLDVSTAPDFSSFVIEDLDVGNVNSYEVDSLSEATTYFYRVRSDNGSTMQSDTIAVSTSGIPGGNAIHFDGTNQHVSFESVSTSQLTDMTIEIWYHPDAISNWQRVFDFGTAPGRNIFLTISPSDNVKYPRFVINNGVGGEQRLNSSIQVSASNWYHFAIVLEGNMGIMYLNGMEVDRNNSFLLNPNDLGATFLNYVGKSQYEVDPYLNGKVADFRIWDHARTSNQINANMYNMLAGNEPGLVGYFFEQPACDGSVTDMAGTNHGTLQNGPYQQNVPSSLSEPVSLSLTDRGLDSVRVNWLPPLDGTAENYTLQLDDADNFLTPEMDSSNITDLFLDIKGLTPGNVYYYRVKATNVNGDGPFTCAQVIDMSIDAPEALAAIEKTDTSFTARWNPVGLAENYLVDVSRDPDFSTFIYENLGAGNVTSMVIDTLLPSTTYYYRVYANNSTAGTSDPGNVIASSTTRVGSGNVMFFDGSNDYVSFGITNTYNNLSTGNFTIEMMIKTSDVGRSILLGNYFGDPSLNFEVHSTGGGVLRTYLNGNSFMDDDVVADGEWHHVATVVDFDNDFVKMYIDGVETYSAVNNVSPYSVNRSMMLGRDPRSGSHYYDGEIDDVRVWNYAKTQNELNVGMNQVLTGMEEGLISLYDFEDYDCETDILADKTSSGLDGTLVNGPEIIVPDLELTPPVNISIEVDFNTIDVSWGTPVKGIVTKYLLQIDDNMDFSSPEVSVDSTQATTYQTTLEFGKVYYLRMQSGNGEDLSAYSCVMEFETMLAPMFGDENLISDSINFAYSVYVADIDGDGDNDILSASNDDDNISWYSNVNGDGSSWEETVITGLANGARMVRAGDLDNDGDQDVAAIVYYDDAVVWFENKDGKGTYGPINFLGNFDEPYCVEIGDIDGDGKPDIIAGFDWGRRIVYFKNYGNGAFGNASTIYSGSIFIQTIALSDIDGDGDLDILSGSSENDIVFWLENEDGKGMFGPVQDIGYPDAVFVAAADMDNDGDMDVITTSYAEDWVGWYENLDGKGHFSEVRLVDETVDGPRSLSLEDIDMDGDMDMVVVGYYDGIVSWYENMDSKGTSWSKHVADKKVSHYPMDAVAADIDGDADMDIVAGYRMDILSWYELYTTKILESPASQEMCDDGPASFKIAARDLVAYKWQVDDGSGYTDIYDDATYSGSGTDSLHVNATSALNGHLYRCIVYNEIGDSVISDGAALVVDDTEAPVPVLATLPDVTGECEVAVLTTPEATDNCDISFSITNDATLPITTQGTTVVTWTYTDAKGNASQQSQNVLVQDITNPTITCPGDQEVTAEEGSATYTLTGTGLDPVANDNCGIASVINDFNSLSSLDGVVFSAGVHSVTWTTEDLGGNVASCSFTLTVISDVGVSELANAEIQVFPNPTVQLVNIHAPGADIEAVKMYDVTGKLILLVDGKGSDMVIDLTGYANGMYTLKIVTRDKVNTQKVFKE